MLNAILRTTLLAIVGAFFIVGTPVASMAKDEIYTNWRGLAIRGYDPVAYFTNNAPMKGSDEYELKWKKATWRFVSADNRKLFEENPERYAPQYGGYCAWAVAQGYTASVDPVNAWKIVDGKLYLNYDVEVQMKWVKDIPGFIAKGDANWPGVLD